LRKEADIAVEFHFNAALGPATGIEVLCKPSKKALAQKIAKVMHEITGLPLRGDAGWKADNSGAHHRLGFCEAGGLIIEVAFISNEGDMKAYENNFRLLAEGIATVLVVP
jgi:N-acetylmuramoyl-L-alanine amidase